MAEEETSMSKGNKIIILIVVLGLLIGSYIFMKNRPTKKEDAEGEQEKIELSKVEKDKINKMVLQSKDSTLTFIKKGEEWSIDYPHPVKLKQTYIDDIAYSFASLYAERVVDENPDDLSQYGLKEPSVKAWAELEDGKKTKVFYLGDKAPTGNNYYIMLEGDPKVYAVWMNHGEHFSYKMDDIREKKLTEINVQELSYLKMAIADKPVIEIKENDNRSEDEAQFGLGMWKMIKPYNQPMGVDSNGIEKVLSDIPNLEIKGFIDDDPSDLGQYGLDVPSRELVVKDKSNTVHLYFGKDAGDDEVYFKTADSNAVYTMAKEKVSFMDIKPFELVEKFAFIVNIDDVDKIVVEGEGKAHTLTLERSTKKAEKEGEEDEIETVYKVDGKEVEESPFKKYYQSIIGLLVDAENDKESTEKAEVKTTFFLNKGKDREIHVDYVPYDRDFYSVVRQGKAEFIISRDQVHKMLEDLELLIQGKLEND